MIIIPCRCNAQKHTTRANNEFRILEFHQFAIVGVHERDWRNDALPERSGEETSVLGDQTMRPSENDYAKS